MSGPEGIIESQQIVREDKATQTEAVDCKWFIRAPPHSKVGAVTFQNNISLIPNLRKA